MYPIPLGVHIGVPVGWYSEGEGACGESIECVWVPEVVPGGYRVRSGQESEGSPEWEEKEKKCQGRVTIPCIQSVSEEIRWVLGSVNITTHFRPPGTLRQVLFHKVPKVKKNECDLSGGMWSVWREVCG